MKKNDLTIQQKRTESLYEREIRRITYQLSRKEKLPFLPISYCQVDKKLQTLKIYIAFSENNEEEKKILETFNKKYTKSIAHMLALTKRFRRTPRLLFVVDKQLEEINRVEDLIKNS